MDCIRLFFRERGYLDVQTPLRIPAPALEDHIDAEPAGPWYLRTSPELHMKRLLAAGYPRLFQLGPCFRQGERGPRHEPEFTMLEWYRTGCDYLALIDETEALLTALARTAGLAGSPLCRGHLRIDLTPPWERLTVDEAFQRFARCSPEACLTAGDGVFERTLVEQVEPHLGATRPTVLMDYPLALAALARRRVQRPDRAERWELYVAGIELANAFTELTDAAEQRARFETSADLRRAAGRPVYPMDHDFLGALAHGLPPCAGIALGFDRLLMLLAGQAQLTHVLPFPTPAP